MGPLDCDSPIYAFYFPNSSFNFRIAALYNITYSPPINCRVYLKVFTWMDYELRVKVSGKRRETLG